MLDSLAIRDIVLIERLDMAFSGGLSVLTGETGAGKSILLDALGLATGARADASLVRRGAAKGSAVAEFSLPDGHPAIGILAENDIDAEDGRLILRRTISLDGKSRAYVNDQAASVGLLKKLGETLIEVHGQHDDRGLLDPAGHRALVDAYALHPGVLEAVATRHAALQAAEDAAHAEREALDAARQEEEFDRHALTELERLDPRVGEEEELAEARQLMMQGEKTTELLDGVAELLEKDGSIDAALRSALRKLERTDEAVRVHLEDVIAAFERAAEEAGEGLEALGVARRRLEFDPQKLEDTEERLFALRALARKHKCTVDQLPDLREDFAARVQSLARGEQTLKELEAAVGAARSAFGKAVGALTKSRQKAADALSDVVNAELPPLKLARARFRVMLTPLDEAEWGPRGGERVAFQVATLAGADFGPLKKIASGGELARFVLALKVALAGVGTAPSLVFDEVDRGIGGAVADAVGKRLARLAGDVQVLVVTHSPQVAARGDHHWRVVKFEMQADKNKDSEPVTLARIAALTSDERREEIARMLSGAAITEEARAAAGSLIREAG